MEDKTISVIILFGAGLFSILASAFNWNFFFENRKAKLLTGLIGRNGARILYVCLGLFLFFLAYKSGLQ